MHPEFVRLRRDFGWKPEPAEDPAVKLPRTFEPGHDRDSTVFKDYQWAEMNDLINNSWWYHTRNNVIYRALMCHEVKPTLWDIGCGSGVVTKYLSDFGVSVVGVEPSHHGALLAMGKGLSVLKSHLQDLRLPTNSVSSIAMFDVLEHLANRDEILKEIHRVLEPDGHLVLTLPALMSLWSEFDEHGYQLRYNKRAVKKELQRNGFLIEHVGYFFLFTVAPLYLLRALPFRLGRRQAVASKVSLRASGGIFGRALGRLEVALASRIPFGTSLIVIAKKVRL